jgi:restriction system protein
MAIPTQKAIELPLLTELQKIGGRAKPKELYPLVAQHFPDLTPEDMQERMRDGFTYKWWNRVQWARQKCVEIGEIDGSEFGVWKITPEGVARVERETTARPARPDRDTISLRGLVRRHENEVREQVIAKLMQLTPEEFEHFGKRLLQAMDFEDVHVTQLSKDGGIDGYGQLQVGIVKVNAAFQCKRWKDSVGAPQINTFRGAIAGEYEQGIVITTSSFTKDALKLSMKRGTVPIVMVDGERIVDLMVEQKIGISHKPITIIEIEDDFFQFADDEDAPAPD